MRIAVIGAGAIGGYVGGLLARAGADVAFIARGDTLAALRTEGLTIAAASGSEGGPAGAGFRVDVVATDDPFLPPPFLEQAVVSKIAGAKLAVVKGPGHYPQVERPDALADVVRSFLADASK